MEISTLGIIAIILTAIAVGLAFSLFIKNSRRTK